MGASGQVLYLVTGQREVVCIDPSTAVPHRAQGPEGETTVAISFPMDDKAPEENPHGGRSGHDCIIGLSVTESSLLVALHGGRLYWCSHGGPQQQMQVLSEFYFPHGPIHSLSYHPDAGDSLVLDTDRGSMYLLSQFDKAWTPSLLLDFHSGPITGLAPHPDGTHVLSCSSDGSVRVWSLRHGQLVGTHQTPSTCFTCLAAASTKAISAVGSTSGVLRAFAVDETSKLQLVFRSRLYVEAIQAIAFSPSATMLVSATEGGHICFLAVKGTSMIEVLGYIQGPEGVLGLSWPLMEGDSNVLVGLAGGGVAAISAPPPDSELDRDLLLSSRDVQSKVMRLETTMTQVCGVSGAERCGTIYTVGPDKHIHKFVLPCEGQQWAGMKGRVQRANAKVASHKKTGTAVAVSSSGQLLASGSADGSVAVRYSTLTGTEGAVEVRVHDTAAGGISALCFSATGKYIISGGHDGALFVHEVTGSSHLQDPVAIANSSFNEDKVPDKADMSDELTHSQALKKRKREEVVEESMEQKQEVLRRLEALKDRLQECVQLNEMAHEAEKVDQDAFIIDLRLQSELMAEADKEIQKLEGKVQFESLKLEVITERIKTACWSNMQVKGTLVTGIRSALQVWNFPLEANTKQDTLSRKVSTLRQVEMLQSQGPVDPTSGSGLSTSGGIVDPSVSAVLHPEASQGGLSVHNSEGELTVESSSRRVSRMTSATHQDAINRLIYPDMEVTCPGRKVTQIHLFQQQIRELKEAFNTEFETLSRRKVADLDRITDLQQKIRETQEEVVKLGGTQALEELVAPCLASLEDIPGNVFTVCDDELTEVRYVSPEEQARIDAEKRAEEECARRAAEDDAFDRALKQMMNGTLESQHSEAVVLGLQKPSWMINADPKTFNEEQMREYKEYQAKEKQAAEEKLKRKTIMETELRSMKVNLDDIITKFDEAILQLSQQRLVVQTEVLSWETRILLLAGAVEALDLTSEERQQELMDKMTAVKEERRKITQELASLTTAVGLQQDKVNNLTAEERVMDRAFRKEFADAEGSLVRLQQLYKTRGASVNGSIRPGATSNDGSQPGQEGLVRPDSVEIPLWERFLEYLAKRIRLAEEVAREAAQLLALQLEHEELHVTEENVSQWINSLTSTLAHMKSKNKAARYDVDLQLELKQGQVEVKCNGVDDVMGNAIFIDHKVVEHLNETVRHKGQKKLEVLQAIKDFKKNIYLAEWENRRCDLQAEDVLGLTKELQLLHVTKGFQEMIKAGHQKVNTKEISNMEALLKAREALHAKKLAEKQRQYNMAQAEIAAKSQQNMEVQSHLQGLQHLMEDQERLQKSVQTQEGTGTRKMKSLVTHRKLKDIAKAQKQELELLQRELARLHAKSFPSFVQVPRVLPDEKATT